ncbi:hypothetical protein C1H46_000545 [Malus baccata]|uniref:Uncharacterized protein n=1 Tax=Malus baccata TaxID=106549 RepID=A0A540NSA4_MALBA|nr:hypothetical protein C1H46_000545 [Malus baccata]
MCAGKSGERRQATAMKGSSSMQARENGSDGHEMHRSLQTDGPQLLISDGQTQRQAMQSIGVIGSTMPNAKTEISGTMPIIPNLPALQQSLPELVEGGTKNNHLSVVLGKLGIKRAVEGPRANSRKYNKRVNDEGNSLGSGRRKGWRRLKRGAS